jgi:xanthine/CO dehydrogenase XdhC/CoxF family maturation factor
LDPELHGQLVASARSILQAGGQLTWLTSTGADGPGFWKSCLAGSPEADATRLSSVMPVAARPLLAAGQAEGPGWSITEEGTHQFLEPMGQTLRLIIVGAGHIARPLCKLAVEVGYRVLVLDDRPEYARRDDFPDAFEVVAGDYAEHLPRLAAFPSTSVVLVTRGHKHDQDCLRLMANQPLDYLGMIGSQRRIDAVYAELVEEGFCLDRLRAVHAPIGLEIGAHTPAEIAVSIVAQLIKVRRLPDSPVRGAADRKRNQRSLRSREA